MAEGISRSSSVVDEEEVFEITDFTTVSDWEKFVAQISGAISDWQLTCIEHVKPLKKNELTMGTWEQLSKEIRFSNAIFMLTLYRMKPTSSEDVYFEESGNSLEDELHLPIYMDDMMSTSNDFPPRAHCLVRWYGFRSFLVLSLISSGTKGVEGLTSESKCNLILSSACIVLSDSGCEVPIFIQIQQNWRKMFTGRCIGTGMQTEFEMVHLKKCPPQYQHLSGLLHIFKSKTGRPISPVQISARFTYILSNWGRRGVYPQQQIDPEVAARTLDKFQFGCIDDPIGDLQLSAMWPSVTEDLIVENDVHSDFNPTAAPVWAIRLHYTDNPECLLSGYLKEMIKLRHSVDTFGSLVTTTVKLQDSNQDIGQALSKLTDSSHKMRQMVPLVPGLTSGISKIVTSQRSKWTNRMRTATYTTVGPISESLMPLIMEYLLPENEEIQADNDGNTDETAAFVHDIEHQLKSAPKNSPTYRLATCFTVINFCHGGMAAIAQVWHEFVQEMRYRFENGIAITNFRTENPDLGCCLLHQKLQMLNCCILHKINREKHQNKERQEKPSQDDESVENHESYTTKEGDTEDQCKKENPLTGQEEESGSKLEAACRGDDLESSYSLKKESVTPPPEPLKNPTIDPYQEKESQSNMEVEDVEESSSVLRKESATSLKSLSPPESPSWREEVSSIDDEFFDCEDGESNPSEEGGNKEIKSPEDSENHRRSTEIQEIENSGENHGLNEKMGEHDVDNISSKDEEKDRRKKDVENAVCGDNDASDKVAVPTDPSVKPLGRCKAFGEAKLLNFDMLLYIPITQEPAPLTEDVLEERTKIFSSLGDSAEGALLRRKMQSASLLSDMESFKAANPGCVLADFVRWYSPRDYEEGDAKSGKLGCLSERMRIPGNIWQAMWDAAKSIPARRQKRLFDDTKEGEKVLHFFTSLQPKDLILLLLPMCFHEAINVLQEKGNSGLQSVPTLCNQILTQACKLFQGDFKDKWAQMDDIWQKIQFTETLIERAASLKHKFAKVKGHDTFIRRLIENPEVVLDGAANGDVGHIVKQYFFNQTESAQQRYSTETEPPTKISTLPPPSGREYILRSTAPRPSVQSRPLPHRLYAVLIKNEFRLAGAFSSDTVFF